jgi:hypothetical protein
MTDKNLRIIVTLTEPDLSGGVIRDVTEAVKALYDLAIGSMDFGSGFWSAEDARPVAELARICGFEQAEEVQKYLDDRLFHEEQSAWMMENPIPGVNNYYSYRGVPHDHVYSRINNTCLWPRCKHVEGEPEEYP